MNAFAVIGVTRPSFLVLTPACVSLGVATAVWSGAQPDWVSLAVILIGALAAHVGVNALNEYADFRSGLDFRTQRTPFSGGSGTLVRHPALAPAALAVGVLAVAVTLSSGLYLVSRTGWGLVPIGLLGLATILLYSGPVSHNRYLCLVAPGLGFGPLMVVGTHYTLTGAYSAVALGLSLVPFFLVNNLLLLNQFPDIDADRSVGRDNFPVAVGPSRSALIYGAFSLLAFLTPAVLVLAGWLPVAALLGVATSLLALQVFRGARDHGADAQRLLPFLGKNVLVTLATPALISAGVFLAAPWGGA
jgi:1,4-dihydroxy-2-naphthoate octaprenyltransferase